MKLYFENINWDRLFQSLGQLLGLILVFLAPLKTTIIALFFIMLIDFTTGIWASIKSKIPITSKRMRDTVGKFSAYVLAIIGAHIFQQIFGIEDIDITKITAFILAFVELKSIFENVSKIVGFDLWQKIKGVLAGKKSLKDAFLEEEEK